MNEIPIILLHPLNEPPDWPFFGQARETLKFVVEFKNTIPTQKERLKWLQHELKERVRYLEKTLEIKQKLEADILLLEKGIRISKNEER
jgi:hypothetical protein